MYQKFKRDGKKVLLEPAPMAGFTDLAFRKVLRKCGAKITWTEMISATALFHNSEKTKEMLGGNKYHKNTVVQLFGKNPSHFESVIKSGTLDKFTEININMGCPARKITSNGDGVALMKNQKLAKEIIGTCVRVSKKPVSVKMRLGFDKNIAVEFAKMCKEAGASRIIVHGRLGTQGYSGKADYDAIAEVVRAVNIPVIANGDIRDATHAAEVVGKAGAAGAMIGRALIGAPWAMMTTAPNEKAKRRIILFHIKTAERLGVSIQEMRKHLVAYCKDKEIKKRLAVCKSFDEANKILKQI